jgi:hypothetical protein
MQRVSLHPWQADPCVTDILGLLSAGASFEKKNKKGPGSLYFDLRLTI